MKAFLIIKEDNTYCEYVDSHENVVWLKTDFAKEAEPYRKDKVEVSYPPIEDIIRGSNMCPPNENRVVVRFLLNGIRRIDTVTGNGSVLPDREREGHKLAYDLGFNGIPLELFEIHHDENYDIYLTVDLEELVK
jgi:hypothetical protein